MLILGFRGETMRNAVGWLLIGLLLGSCSATSLDNELVVEIKTDLVPGVEFHSIRTVITRDAGSEPLQLEFPADTEVNYFTGARIAEFQDLTAGEVTIQVSMLDAQGNVLVERPTRVALQSRYALTVVISRDCRGVACPLQDGDPNLEACLGGRCVDARCHPQASEFCAPTALECSTDTDCVAETACVQAQCIEHTCFQLSNAALCESYQSCDFELGCVGEPPPPPPPPLPTCDDAIQNGNETAVDCGGDCPACAPSEWLKSFGDASDQAGVAIGTDSVNNLYIAGRFQGTVNFGGGDLSAPNYDLYVASFDNDGTYRWSKQFIATGGFIYALAVDADDNLYIAGEFSTSVMLDGVNEVFNSGTTGAFVASFDADGTYRWSRTFHNASSTARIQSLTTDELGAVYITGSFANAIDFGSGAALPSNNGSTDMFVASYQSDDGTYRWTAPYGDGSAESGRSIVADADGTHYVTGIFNGSIDFGCQTHNAIGAYDLFVVRFDADGDCVWSKEAGSSASDSVYALALNGSDQLLVGGDFGDDIDFGTGVLSPAGSSDAFIFSVEASTGLSQWSRKLGGTGFDRGKSIAVGANDVVYMAGDFSETVDFGDQQHTSNGIFDIFVIAYDATDGTAIHSVSYGGTASDTTGASCVDQQDAVYAIGNFWGTVDFDLDTLDSQGLADIFVIKRARP
jgi:hypothetical protein